MWSFCFINVRPLSYLVFLLLLDMLLIQSSVSIQSPQVRHPPTLAPQFTSQFHRQLTYQALYGDYPNENYTGVVSLDTINERMTLNYSFPSAIYPHHSNNITVYELSYYQGFYVLNDQCRSHGYYQDPFPYWIQYATYVGETIFDGILCQIYTYNSGENFTLYANGTLPVLINKSYVSSTLNISDVTTLYNLQPSISKDAFEPPNSCYGDSFVCPGGNITEIEFYRFHPLGDVTIDNRNTANALGDVYYVCKVGSFGLDTHISLMKAKVNTSWGQYQFCNYDQCVGLVNVPSVGHEAPEGITYKGGQCSDNVGVGSWYSFNASFKCANENNFDNCAWYGPTSIGKTIDVSCLDNHGFFNACLTDGGIPYPKALEIWNKAFKYNKTSQGGCPHISPLAASDYSSDTSHQKMVPKAPEKKNGNQLLRERMERRRTGGLFDIPLGDIYSKLLE